jgi:hypothetical protein
MHIIINQIHRRLHLHCTRSQPVARPGAELAWWAGLDAGQARSFIDRHFLDPARLHLLRHALGLDGHGFDPARRSDDEVRQAGARRLAAGAWRIASEAAVALKRERASPAPAASPLLRGAGSAGAARTSGRLPPPVSRAPAPAPAAPAPAAAPDWPDSAAQLAQAKTLQRAARDGTPFCEICEARRRAAGMAAA